MKKENKAGNELLGRRKSRIFALWVNVCLIFSLLLNSVTAMAQERGGTKVKVACVGASTTYGFGSDTGGYPTALQALLGSGYDVQNFGRNSTTVLKNGRDGEWDHTPGSCAYYGSDIHTSSLNYQADIVLIMIGANDTKPVNWNDGDNNFEEDYKALIESYLNQGNNPQIYVVTDAWVKMDNFGISGKTLVESVIPIERKVAEAFGLGIIDNYHATENQDSYYIGDGIHMNDTGYYKTAELIADTIREVDGSEDGSFSLAPPKDGQDYNCGNPRGIFDGCSVIQWVGDSQGWFKYDNGVLASAFGVENGTIVSELTMTFSYYYDNQAGNDDDMLKSITYDQNNRVAPSPGGGEDGLGYLIKDDPNSFHLVSGEWAEFTISRQNQKLGNTPWDWYFELEHKHRDNAFYLRGYEITVRLADGTAKTGRWGIMNEKPEDVPELFNAVYNAYRDLDTSAYTKESAQALEVALEAAKSLKSQASATQEQFYQATEAIMRAAAGLALDTEDLEVIAKAAQEAAEAAREAAAAAQRAADKAQEDANKAWDEARANQEEAKEAIRAAENAQMKAEEAEKTANEAKSAAEAAKHELERVSKELELAKEESEKQKEQLKEAMKQTEAAQEESKNYAEAARKAAEAAKAEAELAKSRQEEAQKVAEACKKEAEAAKQTAKDLLEKEMFRSKKVNLKSVKSSKKKQMKISWKAVKGAEGYIIQYADNSKFQKAKKLTINKGTTAARNIKKVKSGRNYYVRIKAYRTIGGEKVYTRYSSKKHTKIK